MLVLGGFQVDGKEGNLFSSYLNHWLAMKGFPVFLIPI